MTKHKKIALKLQNITKFHEIVKDIPALKNNWSMEEIGLIKILITDYKEIHLVGRYFSKLKTIPEELLEPLIYDNHPHFMKPFINNFLRIFGFERILKGLDSLFKNGDNTTKIRVLRNYYLAKPLFRVQKEDISKEKNEHNLKWNISFYLNENLEASYDMTELEISKSKKIYKNLLIERITMFLQEFLENKNYNVRSNIQSRLPDKLSSFSKKHQELAIEYFKVIENISYISYNEADSNLKKSPDKFF